MKGIKKLCSPLFPAVFPRSRKVVARGGWKKGDHGEYLRLHAHPLPRTQFNLPHHSGICELSGSGEVSARGMRRSRYLRLCRIQGAAPRRGHVATRDLDGPIHQGCLHPRRDQRRQWHVLAGPHDPHFRQGRTALCHLGGPGHDGEALENAGAQRAAVHQRDVSHPGRSRTRSGATGGTALGSGPTLLSTRYTAPIPSSASARSPAISPSVKRPRLA
jgi:hypothetical protein